MFKFVSISVSMRLLSTCAIQLQFRFIPFPFFPNFLQILLMFLFVAATTMVANGQAYDVATEMLEMALDAVENGEYPADFNEDGENDVTEESTGYIYNEGDLEDNINIAVNAAILDKYGQAVTSEISSHEADKKVELDDEDKDHDPEKGDDSVQADQPDNSLDSTDYEADKTESVETSANPERSSKSFKQATSSKAAEKLAVKSAKSAVPVKNVQYDDNDTITRFVSQVNADGTYGFDFAQSSGLEFKEVGQGGLYAQGSYQYISPEGEHIAVTYRADETGFHPESDILPTPPPIPSYILKALEYIREHPSAEEKANREARAQEQV